MAPPTPEELAQMQAEVAAAVLGPDGAMPLAETEVRHFGTVQRYKCWRPGPNSAVLLTLPELFEKAATRLDQPFIVFEDERYTYGEILSRAAALGRELRAGYGVAKGERVAISARNYPEWVVAFIAAAGIGACVLPVNSWWKGDELRYGLEDSGAKVLFADAERLDSALPFLAEVGVRAVAIRCERAGAAAFGALVAAGRARPSLPPVVLREDDMALIMYTSGTTSKPKGVMSTQRNVMSAMNTIQFGGFVARAGAEAVARRMGQPPPPVQAPGALQDCLLCSVPLFHATGLHAIFLAGFFSGRKLVLMPKWNVTQALQLIAREKVTSFIGVPTMSYEIMNHPDFDKYDTTTLQGLGGGGAAFRSTHAADVAKKFKNASGSQGWGMTETNAISTVNHGPGYLKYPTSCGRAHVNVELCVLDEAKRKLPTDGVGELCIRGATIMSEYWNKPDKTKETFHIDEEGKLWMMTGDVAKINSEGYVFILDRIKDMIIRGGENISCAEVEAAVYTHPAVSECAVFGLPDERLGEVVSVAVVWKKGQPPPADKALQDAVAERIAKFKVPARIFAWADAQLPRGATGKIQKRDIRDWAKKQPQGASKL